MKILHHLFIVLVLFLPACRESQPDKPQEEKPIDNPPPEPVEPVIVFSKEDGTALSALDCPAKGGEFSFVLTCNSHWTISVEASWLTPLVTFGEPGQTTVLLKANPYMGVASRMTRLKVELYGSLQGSSELEVTQAPYRPSALLQIGPDPAVARPAGGSSLVTLHCDEDWTVSTDQSWLTVEPSSGTAGDAVLTLTAEANPFSKDRTAELLLSKASGQEGILIRQHANIFRRTHIRQARVREAFVLRYSSGVRFNEIIMLLPYPETNEYQEISDSDHGNTPVYTSDTGVNYLMEDMTSNFPASGSDFIANHFTVDYYTVTTSFADITEPDLPYDTESAAYKRYTSVCVGYNDDRPFHMIDPTHPTIVEWADMLWEKAGGNRINYARQCYNFVASNFTYGIFDDESGDNSVEEIIDRMMGDCGNQHAIWMSLMRCKGIPARPIVMQSPEGPYSGGFSHVRGEFYLAGYGWIPVDVTYHQGGGDYFGKFTNDNLIVMNRDFSFDYTAGGEVRNCSLLQVIWWLFWYHGSGTVDASYIFQEL